MLLVGSVMGAVIALLVYRASYRRRAFQKGGSMVLRLIKAAVIAGLAALIIQSLPDIRRYLEMRSM